VSRSVRVQIKQKPRGKGVSALLDDTAVPGRAWLLTDRQRGYARRAAAVRRKEQPMTSVLDIQAERPLLHISGTLLLGGLVLNAAVTMLFHPSESPRS
jgi:hypothetical protein